MDKAYLRLARLALAIWTLGALSGCRSQPSPLPPPDYQLTNGTPNYQLTIAYLQVELVNLQSTIDAATIAAPAIETAAPTVAASPESAASEQPTPDAPLPQVNVTILTESGLNLRTEPHTDAHVLGLLETGRTVKVVGRMADNQWLQVEVMGDLGLAVGWIAYDPEWASLDQPLEVVPVTLSP